jgi:hypothetical protein
MKKILMWNKTKKRLFSVGATFGLAFADFDPATPPPEYKQVVQFEETSSDDKEKNKKSN